MFEVSSSRRSFLTWLTSLLLAFLGLCLAIPALAYFCSPLRKKRGATDSSFLLVGPVADLPPGQWCLRSVEVVRADGWKKESVKHAIWVRREANRSEVMVLSSTCPHLGCPINWHTDGHRFQCPCHGGVFSPDGTKVSGPPPRSMDRLQCEVRGNFLWVRWQDFKIGISNQVPVTA